MGQSVIFKGDPRLTGYIPEPVYYLNNVASRCIYKNGEKTDQIAGYVYTATNTDTFDQINVLVEQKKPLIEPDELRELQNAGEKVFVEFIDAIVKPYYNSRTRTIEDSIKAQDIRIVETK